LGWIYRRQGKLTEAVEAFNKAIELNPQNDRAYAELGWIYRKQGKLTEAVEALNKAIELNPQNDWAYSELGWIYSEQGKLTEAVETLNKAIEFNPQNDRTYGRLAVVYSNMGEYVLYKEFKKKAEQLRERFYRLITINNYRRCKQILSRRKVRWICVQYPLRGIGPLKKIFEGDEDGVYFVDNEEIFRGVVRREGYSEYFTDMFGGDFGHCTKKGNRLLAENIANVILKEIFGK
ncbi:tetratricopeptide repeat protein, partial [Candidatus Gottesmanbacteria bacterium]|nr:tetratricopeptide repeat protein [Candidatus Gottesmanbacteria bacterium]